MNKQRRKELEAILNELADLRARTEAVKDEEQEAYDNMPEALQQVSERGQKAEQACSLLDDALSAFDEIDNAISEAME